MPTRTIQTMPRRLSRSTSRVPFATQAISGGHVAPDPAAAEVIEVVLNAATVYFDAPGSSPDDGKMMLVLKEDGTGGRQVDFTTSGAYEGVSELDIDVAPNTYTTLYFIKKPSGKYLLLHAMKGISIT